MAQKGQGVFALAKLKIIDIAERRSTPDVNMGKGGESSSIHQMEGASNAIAENKPRKLKLKVDGVTCTILETNDGGISSAKHPCSVNSCEHRLKVIARVRFC